MKTTLIALCLLAGCSTNAIRHINHAGSFVMVASLAADWCQTRSAAEQSWSRGRSESGMLTMRTIGTSPSPASVDAYFLVGTVALLGAAQLLPERYRSAVYAVATGIEVATVSGNLETTNCLGVGR